MHILFMLHTGFLQGLWIGKEVPDTPSNLCMNEEPGFLRLEKKADVQTYSRAVKQKKTKLYERLPPHLRLRSASSTVSCK